MSFIDELKRLHEAATEGKENAGMDLRDFLEDHAPAIIALVEAAKDVMTRIEINGGLGEYNGGPAFAESNLRQALAALNAEAVDE